MRDEIPTSPRTREDGVPPHLVVVLALARAVVRGRLTVRRLVALVAVVVVASVVVVAAAAAALVRRGSLRAAVGRARLGLLRGDGELRVGDKIVYRVEDGLGVGVERVFLGDDPIGFIKITNPPEKLTIYNGY